MAINLKQILLSDTDNIKLEKVNYNFDQIVANGGGPQGVVGDPGAMGYQGVTGYQGDQGIPGEQGFQGADGDSGELVWKENLGSASKTILPIHDALTTPNAPTIAIGYKSNSQFYINSVEESTSLLINKDGVLQNNLELRTEGSLDAFYYRLRTDNSIHTMQTGFKLSSGTAVLNQYASEWNWISETTQNTLITLDSTKLQVDIESEFNEPVSINNTLKISGTNSGAAVDKIAISTDADGTIDFKSIDEIGGVVPIGTIVSVDPAFFNSSNFKLTETNVTAPSDAPIEIRVGSGINNFAGWYLCNGQTWNNGLDPATIGYVGYQTEDLNSFSYSIDENPATIDPDSQGEVSVTNNSVPLIGGADVTMAATYNAPNYNISGTVQTTSQPISSDSNGTTFILKRLPQIIYLGAEDLFWQDKGTNQAAPVSVTYRFTDENEGAGGIPTINEVKNESEGSSFSFTVYIAAASGYQWDSLPTFSSTTPVVSSVVATNPSGSFPASSINVTVNVSAQPQGGTVTLTYNSSTHSSAIIARTNTYTINNATTSAWSITPTSVTVTDTPGDTVQVGLFKMSAPSDQYFDKSKTPTLPFTFRGSGTMRGSDVGIANYSYRDIDDFIVTPSDSSKAYKLWLNISDTDFADAGSVPGGTTDNTTINISGFKLFDNAPYVGYTTTWTGGNNSWNSSGNYSQHYSTVSNRTWNIVNNTEELVNIRLRVSDGSSSGPSLSAEITNLSSSQNPKPKLAANTGSTSLNGGGSSTSYSTSTFSIPAGSNINIEWDLLSVPNNNWSAGLQYYTGTNPPMSLNQEMYLGAKLV